LSKNVDVSGRAPAEVRIAYEVAMSLRILPRFSDDGAPEGTVERPVGTKEVEIEPTAIGAVAERLEVRTRDEPDEEDEVEISLGELL